MTVPHQKQTTSIIDNLLTREEAAGILNLTPRSLDRWAGMRYGPVRFKIGNKTYYDRTDIEAFLLKKKQEAWG